MYVYLLNMNEQGGGVGPCEHGRGQHQPGRPGGGEDTRQSGLELAAHTGAPFYIIHFQINNK